MRQVTIVFDVVNEDEFEKYNPLKIEVNGLKATGVSMGDLMAEKEELTQRIEDYMEDSCI